MTSLAAAFLAAAPSSTAPSDAPLRLPPRGSPEEFWGVGPSLTKAVLRTVRAETALPRQACLGVAWGLPGAPLLCESASLASKEPLHRPEPTLSLVILHLLTLASLVPLGESEGLLVLHEAVAGRDFELFDVFTWLREAPVAFDVLGRSGLNSRQL